MNIEKKGVLEEIRGNLIVSCQALPGEPLYSSFIMGKMACAAVEGGARAIRANSVEDILEIQRNVNTPIIGIIKEDYQSSPKCWCKLLYHNVYCYAACFSNTSAEVLEKFSRAP